MTRTASKTSTLPPPPLGAKNPSHPTNTNNNSSIWAAQQIITVHGYKRRTCRSASNAAGVNMPKSAMRPDGLYTRGMQDFEVKMPARSAINCEGTCDPMWKPGQLPQIDPSLHPIN